MNILVLGGNGFIGSHVVDHLIATGRHRVRVFDHSAEKYRSPLANIDYVFGNFNDISSIAKSLQDIDVVIHLISTTLPSTSNDDPEEDIRGNLINTVNLLDQMKKDGLRRIIYISSGGTVYGNIRSRLISEDHVLNPVCSYGIVKVAIEKYLNMYQYLYGFEPLVFRVSNPYGPRQGHTGIQGLIGTFLNKFIQGEPLEIWGNGNIVRDYIYIDDLARLFATSIEGSITGVFNVGSGIGHSINEVVEVLKNVVGFNLDVRYEEERRIDVPRSVLDIQRVKNIFGWKPEVSLEQGIANYLNWLKSQDIKSLKN